MGTTKVAILGSRGILACYSGYDTLVEAVSLGLVESGTAQVSVYCRSAYYEDRPGNLNGVSLIYLPAPRKKALESLLHSFLSTLHVLGKGVDVVYFVDPANAPFCLLLRLCGMRVVIHTDGLGWKRRKWGPLARRYYKFVEWLSAHIASALITDNPEMQKYYWREYHVDSNYIPYGASHHAGQDDSVYERFRLSPKKYLLVVARLEPENNIDFVLEEYTRSSITMPLVVVGDAPYNSQYMSRLHELADERVHFTGRINDQSGLNALYKGAYLYIHGHEVGGTNPSLLRAMDAQATPVVIDVPFNRAVAADCAFFFTGKEGHLSALLEHLMVNPMEVRRVAQKAKIRADTRFRWDDVVAAHVELFRQVGSAKP